MDKKEIFEEKLTEGLKKLMEKDNFSDDAMAAYETLAYMTAYGKLPKDENELYSKMSEEMERNVSIYHFICDLKKSIENYGCLYKAESSSKKERFSAAVAEMVANCISGNGFDESDYQLFVTMLYINYEKYFGKKAETEDEVYNKLSEIVGGVFLGYVYYCKMYQDMIGKVHVENENNV